MKQTKLNKLLITLVLSSASIGAFATIGDTPYTLAQKNATSHKFAYLAVGMTLSNTVNPFTGQPNKDDNPNPYMVEVCNVQKDGNLTGCTDSGMKMDSYHASFGSYARPTSIATRGNFAYISNNMDGLILKCNIEPNGHLSGCQTTGSRISATPSWISIHNNNAYIGLQFTNAVYKCGFESNGDLTNCVDSGGTGFGNPTMPTFNGNRAYVTNRVQNSVSICDVESDGSFSNCKIQYPGLGSVYNLRFNNGIAYAPNGSVFVGGVSCHDLIKKCSIAKDGSLENCSTSSDGTNDTNGGFFQPFAIAFNNNYIYVGDNSWRGSVYTPAFQVTDSTMISKCKVTSDGSLTNCEYLKGNFNGVTNIAFH